ncbi:MAG: hypothetical protein IKL52_03980 [Candidatus Gastranaerophilales bacterium]|nr:hypothetical protein [Candidatus Gastranaerophilales bacterium]
MQNNISFKGCIPVEFYVKHPITKKYIPMVKERNVKKCQNWVVRNLNRTLKEENQCDIFISAYKAMDPDYAKTPAVRSYFDKFTPIPKTAHEPAPRCVWLFTGKDVDSVNKIGKELGKEKMDIFEATGEKENAAVSQAKRRYRAGMKDLINRICPRVHDEEGIPYVMRVLFTPEYDKKGMLKKFNFQGVFFDHDFEH